METTARTGDYVKHPLYGKGTIVKIETTFYTVQFPNRGNMDISKRTEDLEILPAEAETPAAADEELSWSKLETTIRRVLTEYSDIQQIVLLGDRWQGGTLVLQPADQGLKAKEIPLETFFHKIVMVRDRLRVLEQQINSHPKLSEEDKIDMQQYITRCYGSLTSFNILFKEQGHHFVGEKKG